MAFSDHIISLTGLNVLLATLIFWLVVSKRWRRADLLLLVTSGILVFAVVFHKVRASPDGADAVAILVENRLQLLQQDISDFFGLPRVIPDDRSGLQSKNTKLKNAIKSLREQLRAIPSLDHPLAVTPGTAPPHPQAGIVGALDSPTSPNRVNLVLKNTGNTRLVNVSGNVRFCEAETGPVKPWDCKLTRPNRRCANDFICPGDNLEIDAGGADKQRFVTIPREYKRKASFRIYVELDYAGGDGMSYSTRCTGDSPARQGGRTRPFAATEFAIRCDARDGKG